MIPKTMNFIWANAQMSYLRYLTLKSFKYFNPDWKIVLHRPTVPIEKETWSHNEQDIRSKIDVDFSSLLSAYDTVYHDNTDIRLGTVTFSDILRWKILSTEGGYYADMDILWRQPFDSFHNFVTANMYDTILDYCPVAKSFRIGLLGSKPDNMFFRCIYKVASDSVRLYTYQGTGADAIVKYLQAHLFSHAKRLDKVTIHLQKKLKLSPYFDLARFIYPIPYNELSLLYDDDIPLSDECLGIHWFGGMAASQKYNQFITGPNVVESMVPDTTFVNLLQKINCSDKAYWS